METLMGFLLFFIGWVLVGALLKCGSCNKILKNWNGPIKLDEAEEIVREKKKILLAKAEKLREEATELETQAKKLSS
jgi:hypothetical protein